MTTAFLPQTSEEVEDARARLIHLAQRNHAHLAQYGLDHWASFKLGVITRDEFWRGHARYPMAKAGDLVIFEPIANNAELHLPSFQSYVTIYFPDHPCSTHGVGVHSICEASLVEEIVPAIYVDGDYDDSFDDDSFDGVYDALCECELDWNCPLHRGQFTAIERMNDAYAAREDMRGDR